MSETPYVDSVQLSDESVVPVHDSELRGRANTSNPPPYALDGKNLKDTFADADALWAALEQEDYSHIRLGDYWPVTLNGSFRDYGEMTCQQGQTYYSDTAMTTEAGTASADMTASPVDDAALLGGHKPYCEIKISGTTYYCAYADCLPYRVKTLNNAVMMFEAMPNVYWRYGDSGANDFQNGKPHILFSPRDGLPTVLKMRKTNETWEGQHVETFTGDGTTAAFVLTGAVGTLGHVFVGGAKKTIDTDYTYAADTKTITFKSGKIPASGAEIAVEWMEGATPWTGSAIYRTFNDPDYGIIKLIQQADAKLYAHIYKGPNGKGMRYRGETRTKSNKQGDVWTDRGLLFLPTEDEIWGRPILSATGLSGYAQMQQWPIYQLGGRRHFAKGAGNAASRYTVWCASSTSVVSFALVYYTGIPYGGSASYAYVASPGFIFAKPTT